MTATFAEPSDRIERGEEAWRLATAAYDALLELLADLDDDEWHAPTVCDPWTVADMVGHLIGAAKGHAALIVGLRQQAVAARRKGAHGGSALDAWTAQHVADHADLTPAERFAELRAWAPRAVRGRARLPRLLEQVPVSLPPAGSIPAGSPTKITLGELNTVVYTRDAWLHRIDIARRPDATPVCARRSTAASSPTSSLSGRAGTAARSSCTSPARPAGGTVAGAGDPRSSSTRSSCAGSSPGAASPTPRRTERICCARAWCSEPPQTPAHDCLRGRRHGRHSRAAPARAA